MPELTPELRSLLTPLLLPPVPLLVLTGCGAALLRKHRRSGRLLLGLGLIGLWLSCTEGAAQWLGLHLLHRPPALSQQDLLALRAEQQTRHDLAVLVLGGGALPWAPEYGRSELKPGSLERLRYGVWLSRQLDAPLGFTGGVGWREMGRGLSEAELAGRTVAEDYGLKLRWMETRSHDTRENAANSVPLLAADGIRKIVLVTHATHMPRAQRDFERAAQGRVTLLAAPVSVRDDAMSELSDWLPSSSGYERFSYDCYEFLGLLAGH
jgi:uncharacterized SAM-binding protein YcdF (DUF218 family)